MTHVIISDIHSNLCALEAVVEREGADKKYVICGDIVGYGPYPNECIELVKRLDYIAVAGNHDVGAIGGMSAEEFNPEAKEALLWTKKQLNAESIEFLSVLPEKRKLVLGKHSIEMVHGGLQDPLLEYLEDGESIIRHIILQAEPVCFVGHTHVPFTFRTDGDMRIGTTLKTLRYNESLKCVVNVGSVGQPRDGNPEASYVLFDDATGDISFGRVEYDIEKTQKAMEKAGLPEFLIGRLNEGK